MASSLISFFYPGNPASKTSWHVEVKDGGRGTVGHLDVEKAGKKEQRVIETLSNIWSKSKGTADLFSIISKTAALAQQFASAHLQPWLSHTSSTFSQGKSILAVPYFLTTVNKALTPGNSLENRFRNTTEAVSMAGFAGIQIVSPNAWTKSIGGTASCLKTVVDAIDLKQELLNYETHHHLLKSSSVRSVSEEVKKGLVDKLTESARKVSKYFLGVFSGVVAATAFLFGTVLPAPLVLAALVASLGSSIFSFMIEYSKEISPWKVEYREIPAKRPVKAVEV